ncbi:MAG: alkaline phosphatase family protein [Acidobacteria bacterium]|nr:alkaline phosphatase family protein [Acidobacteriota bacterium]
MGDKVLVICLDGATFDLLQPWIEAGRLPTFKRFVDEGVSGGLESVVPPITAPAWASFITGKNPGKHGIYHFVNRGPQAGQQAFVSATSRAGQTLWGLLGEDGKRVTVLNVPTTYPPQKVNGVLISDFLTPPGKRDFTYPPSLLEEIEETFGRYPLHLKTLMFSANLTAPNTERLLRELHHELKYKFDVAHYLLDKYESDFTILHVLGTDRIQHELWNFIDPRHPRYNQRMSERYREQIIEYFARVDAEIERLMERFGDDVTTFIISDHGFGPIHRAIDLNVWLLEQGYIKIKSHARSRAKHLLWKMGLTNELMARLTLKTFFKYGAGLIERVSDETIFKFIRFFAQRGQNNPLFSLDDVDWWQTKAYALVGMGAVNINLGGREPTGSVKAGRDYESLKAEIAEKLKDLTDPDTGRRVNGYVVTREQVYHGPYLEQAPDIMYLPNATGYVAGSMMGFTANKSIIDAPAWPGHHRMNGIFLAKGKAVRQGAHVDGACIIALAPTLLYLMGSRIPRDMDGRVLTSVFQEGFLASRAIEYRDEAHVDEAAVPFSPDEEQQMIERLKDLGYLM